MKRDLLKYLFCFSLLVSIVLPPSLRSQVTYTPERVDMLSDRATYSSAEQILFTGLLSWESEAELLSQVVYVELISPTGQKINQCKLKIDENRFEGTLSIPVDVLSGFYFLRAYTKWMRNGNVDDYAYVLVKIINAKSVELNPVPDSLIILDQSQNLPFENNLIDKKVYNKGEQIRLTDIADVDAPLTCLSIFPAQSGISEINLAGKNKDYENIYYLPETRGLSISGKVMDMNTNQTLAYHKVNLHLQNEWDFISTLSDSLGHFYFALPDRLGEIEILAIASEDKNSNVQLIIDQDYCSKKVGLKVPYFSINPKNKDLLKLVQQAQLLTIYQAKDTITESIKDSIPFYGKAFKSMIMDSFIELDSLSQYFTDLPSYVGIKKEKGNRKLFLSGKESELQLYDPLILVDWIPVDDVESILKINPARIEKFDVIPRPYIHGDILYGGVINIITRNRDFGGFKFPESAIFLSFDFFSDEISYTEYSEFILNNTQEWNSSFRSSDNIIIKAPNSKGNYSILIQSINEKGEKNSISSDFEVR